MPTVWIKAPSRKGGNWRVYWETGGRESRESKNCGPSKGHATWFQEQKRLELFGHAVNLPARSSQRPLAEVAAEYLAYSEKEKSARTFRNFDKPYVTALLEFFPAKRLIDLTTQDGYKWKHHLEGRYSGTTPRMAWRAVYTFLNHSVRLGQLVAHPWKGIAAPDEGDGGGRALTDAEILVLRQVAPEELRRAGDFAMGAGPRIGEVCAFDWRWVREERLHGERVWFGRIPWELRKTRGKVREDCLFPIVGAARAAMGKRQEEGLVFPYPTSTLQHQIVDLREKAKIEGVSFHWFRHTFATRFLRDGGHIEDLLATRLWVSYESLLRYVHVDLATLADRFAAMAPLPTPQAPPNAIKKAR